MDGKCKNIYVRNYLKKITKEHNKLKAIIEQPLSQLNIIFLNGLDLSRTSSKKSKVPFTTDNCRGTKNPL